MSKGSTSARVGDAVLLALATLGPQPSESLPRLCGIEPDDVEGALPGLIRAGLIEERQRPAVALVASARASTRIESVIAAERAELGPIAQPLYEPFRALNRLVKDAVSRWQMRTIGGVMERNDHGDPLHDAEVLADLSGAAARAGRLLTDLAERRSRYAAYRTRLAEAAERAENGERDQVCGLTRDSFHTAWWQLHADLLMLLGRERTSEDA